MRGILKKPEYEIEYFVYGNGPAVLFAFHGFNNHADDFHPLEEIAGKVYTIVSINIFFHGESSAENSLIKKGFSTDDLKELFISFEKLFPSATYSILGYSLGGRVVLKLLEIIPEKINKVILIAPDGLKISLFYRFLTGTLYGNYLLKKVINNPAFFFMLANFLVKFHLVSRKKYEFSMGNFDSAEKRKKVYSVWMILRRIISKKSELKKAISINRIPVHLFFGLYDTIIPASIGKNFSKGMKEFITLTIIESGHRMTKEKILKEIFGELTKIKNDAETTS